MGNPPVWKPPGLASPNLLLKSAHSLLILCCIPLLSVKLALNGEECFSNPGPLVETCNPETGFYTTPQLEGEIATDTFTPSPVPVVYKISGPMGGGFLYTTGAEAENSAVKVSKGSVPPLYKNRSSSTVGTKIIADPEKCFQELISEKLLILLRDRPCLELIIVSSKFQALLFLQDKLLESV